MDQGSLVNLNNATLEELEQLPGVGIVRAWRIVETRNARGPFGTIEELKKVPGLGTVTIERVRSFVVF